MLHEHGGHFAIWNTGRTELITSALARHKPAHVCNPQHEKSRKCAEN
jgi:hypothetical protein